PQRPQPEVHLSVSEVVPDPAYREDQLGLPRIPLDLLAQVANVYVDGTRIAVRGVPPEALEQHGPAEHAAGRTRQDREDLELDVGELHLPAAHLDLALAEVDAHVALLERFLAAVAVRAQVGTAQHRLHAAAELAHRERLGDVVVCAELEAEHLVELLGLGREHDDWDRGARAELAAD